MGQGDTISGRVSRGEVGQAVAAALSSPYSAGKTFELRRDEVSSYAGRWTKKYDDVAIDPFSTDHYYGGP